MNVRCSLNMTPTPQTGAEALDRLAGRDLNADGRIVNLVICGNSKFYNYSWLENAIDEWVEVNAYPDMIILDTCPSTIRRTDGSRRFQFFSVC